MYFPNTPATAASLLSLTATWLSLSNPVAAAATSSSATSDNIVATPINSTLCSGYPGYDASTNSAGPWLLQIVHSGNASIEGYGDTSNYVLGGSGVRFGYITFPTRNDVAKTVLRCDSSAPGAAGQQLQGRVATGVSGYSWEHLQIAPYPYDATLIYQVDGSDTGIFEVEIDGVKQDGVFVGGYDDTVTWGVKYETGGAYGQDFFYIRLLGPNSQDLSTGEPLAEGEFTALIKIMA